MDHPSFIVQRDNLRETRWVEDEAASAPLAADQVRLRVDGFALTSNNVTYGAFGDTLRYWDFYPCAVEGFGRVPVWGFANVVESGVEGVAVGERFYGYYPMSSHVVMQPAGIDNSGFVDGAPHRRELHPVYNKLTRCSTDPGYRADQEAEMALLRPLYITSFLIDDFLADNGFFGAQQVLIASASSKTAYGTAFCLSRRRGTPGAPTVVGLTSPANRAFTESLGCYDRVLAYDDLATLAAATPTVYVDMSGSAPLRAQVHAHFGDRLAYSCSVGGTHWDELGGGKGLAGPRPVMFFAPAQIKKRLGDWGGAGLGQRIAEAWSAFMKPVGDARTPWLTVARGRGPREVEQAWRELIDGRTDPRRGHLLSL
ncbi:MAG TPA: DUF2855 family protein [Albitalea sp.]|uniref:DUF2855 family protein n=1 Tax=Piscinibacter sp. TaxID=1903157 RepID=UPI002ECFC64B